MGEFAIPPEAVPVCLSQGLTPGLSWGSRRCSYIRSKKCELTVQAHEQVHKAHAGQNLAPLPVMSVTI
jgi:hypothetical protein